MFFSAREELRWNLPAQQSEPLQYCQFFFKRTRSAPEEDDSDMIHTNSKQDMLDMQHDKTKLNLSKENCYLVQTTTL